MSQCTCTKDAQMTCIVHPTESSLKARIAELEAVLKATVPKLNRMMRMPNTEWVADEHNAAVEKLTALLGGGENG